MTNIDQNGWISIAYIYLAFFLKSYIELMKIVIDVASNTMNKFNYSWQYYVKLL